MKQFIKFTIALVLGVVAIGFQSCGASGNSKSNPIEDSVTVLTDSESLESSVWKYESLTDEFGDDNGEKVIAGIFDGKFSNSATDGSDAKLQIFYVPGAPIFRIFNYGNQPVKGKNFLRIKVKDEKNSISVLYLLNNDGFFVPTDVPGTLGMNGIDSLLLTEQNLKLSGVLLDGDSDVACLTTEMGYLAEDTGSASGYVERTEANQPKYQFSLKTKGLNNMLKQ